jgi:hypothetical protein
MNFMPKMDKNLLVNGYKKIVSTIYSPKFYYARVINFMKNYKPKSIVGNRLFLTEIIAFIKSTVRLGLFGKERRYYWKLLSWSLMKCRKLFPMAVRFTIYGYHFRKVYEPFQ